MLPPFAKTDLLASAVFREPVVNASSWFAERAPTAVFGIAVVTLVALCWYVAFRGVRAWIARGLEPSDDDGVGPLEGPAAVLLLGVSFVASSLLFGFMLANWGG